MHLAKKGQDCFLILTRYALNSNKEEMRWMSYYGDYLLIFTTHSLSNQKQQILQILQENLRAHLPKQQLSSKILSSQKSNGHILILLESPDKVLILPAMAQNYSFTILKLNHLLHDMHGLLYNHSSINIISRPRLHYLNCYHYCSFLCVSNTVHISSKMRV